MRITRSAMLAALFSLSVACADNSTVTGPSSIDPSAPPKIAATLSVLIKDSPFSDARALFVTFSDVSVHASGGAFFSVPLAGQTATRTCDIKKLSPAFDALGVGSLPPGHYTQVRLTVVSASLYFDNASTGPACALSISAPAGRSAEIAVPSGEVVLNREFDLTVGTATTMMLDFDGNRSIVQTGSGGYILQPVISINPF